MKLKKISALALLGAGLIIGNNAFAQWTKTGTKTYLTNAGDSLGIGTTNPAFKVDIQSTGVATMSLKSTTSNANILFDRKGSTGTASLTYRTNGVNNWQTGTIGNNNYVLKNNSLNSIALFSEYTTNNIGIGTITPGAKLEVAGQVKITGGTPGAGKVLTSDANGLASWTVPATGGFANGTAAGNTPYWNGTSWISNSSNIFNNGGNVGIGTTSPTNKLDVNGNALVRGILTVGDATINAQQIYFLNGTGYSEILSIKQGVSFNNTILASPGVSNVGIGTTSPSAKLHVDGALTVVSNQTTHQHQGAWLEWNKFNSDGRTYLLNQKGLGGGGFVFGEVDNANGVTQRMAIDGNGLVAIGNLNPSAGYMLTVGGSIICTSLKVQLQPFPDYVFASNYKLKSLSEVEDHIKTYSRLPGMPSACEVEDNGMDVGAIHGKVVEKVEELTLYIIQQQKQIDELKALLTSQKK